MADMNDERAGWSVAERGEQLRRIILEGWVGPWTPIICFIESKLYVDKKECGFGRHGGFSKRSKAKDPRCGIHRCVTAG